MSQSSVSPLVSVVMPARNAEKTIGAAISSVRAQTFENWELLIVDDASTDTTLSIIEKFGRDEPRIRVLPLQSSGSHPSGPAATRNRALSDARGQFVAFLDADDYWRPDKLQCQLERMQRSGAVFCYSSYVIFEEGAQTGCLFGVPESVRFAQMLTGSVIGCSTVIYDRSVLGIQLFDDGRAELAHSPWRYFFDHIGHEDYVAWMRLLALIDERNLTPAQGVSEPLVFYRLTPHSLSSNKFKVAAYQFLNYSSMLKLRGWRLWHSFAGYVLNGVIKRSRASSIVDLPREVLP